MEVGRVPIDGVAAVVANAHGLIEGQPQRRLVYRVREAELSGLVIEGQPQPVGRSGRVPAELSGLVIEGQPQLHGSGIAVPERA